MASSSDLSSLDTWTFPDPWISEHDLITLALQKSLSNSDDLISPSTTTFSAGSETEIISKRNLVAGRIAKRRPCASKRSPTTFIHVEPSDFRQMVQQVTGIRFASGQVPAVEPEPQRAVGVLLNRVQVGGGGCILPTLDTSAFLLEHHHQQVAAPVVAAAGPPSVVADGGGAGFDFDGFSCFPTLESWEVT